MILSIIVAMAENRVIGRAGGLPWRLPDDLKRFLEPCWDHRLILNAEAELEGHSSRRILRSIAATVDVPK